MEKTLNKFNTVILFSLIILVPNIFLFSFPNFFVVPKLGLLVIGSLLVVLIKGILLLKKDDYNYKFGLIESYVILLFITYLLSSYIAKVSLSSSFVFPGSASIILFSIVVFFIIKSLSDVQKSQIPLVIIISSLISSTFSVFAYFKFFEKFFPSTIDLRSFTPSGSIVQAVIFSVISLLLFSAIRINKTKTKRLFLLLSKIIIVLGLIINLGKIVSFKKTPLLKIQKLPTGISWKIALETVREKPLFGVGPGNYVVAFNKFRPVEFNSSNLWERKFHAASNFYLTVASETGLVGLLVILLLTFEVVKIFKKYIMETNLRQNIGWGFSFNPIYSSLLLLLTFFVFFPSDILSTFLFFVLLALLDKGSSKKIQEIKIPNMFLGGFLSIISIALLYYSSQFIVAEYRFNQAIKYLIQNNGAESYNSVRSAIQLNPRDDRYRVFYSNVNLLLAQSFARKEEGEEISAESRKTISQFVDQSIREAKVSVNINPERSANWIFLGDVYKSISSLAQNAVSFSIQSYTQGVLLDPLNPKLRVNLGGLYFISGDFESAIEAFKLAILTKPDYTNAHFNLARSYKENGDLENAIKEYETTLLLLETNSDDYNLIKEELDSIKKGLKSKEIQSDNLETPEKLEQLIDPLFEDVEPPATSTAELQKD